MISIHSLQLKNMHLSSHNNKGQSDNSSFIYTDEEFDRIYPENIQKLSRFHWTPVKVAQMALDLLNIQEGTTVLDIGSGAGKFCCLGGLFTEGQFVGVEENSDLINVSIQTVMDLNLTKVSFILGNIVNIDFKAFDAFYYFNPFSVQIAPIDGIDNQNNLSNSNYIRCEKYVQDQFANLKIGTRIVTYCSEDFILPSSYTQVTSELGGTLALWEKVS